MCLGGGGGGEQSMALLAPRWSHLHVQRIVEYTLQERARMLKMAQPKAARHFLQILDCKVQKSTMRHNISRFKARDSSDSNGETPNSDRSRRNCRALFTRQTFEVMASSLGMLHMFGVAVCWCWSHLCS